MSNIPPIPMPVRPLEYDNAYSRVGRPGILTAVGVMSIVVACISMLASVSGILMAALLAMMGTIKPMRLGPPVVTPSTQMSPMASGGLLVAPEEDGLQVNTRAMIIATMRRRRSLNDAQATQLHVLLAQAGKKIFPGDVKTLTPGLVRSNITEAGTIPGDGTSSGSTYFIVGAGRIEAFDDHAVFRAVGSGDVVSVSADGDGSTGGPTVTNSSSGCCIRWR